jgi:hypothetical protein
MDQLLHEEQTGYAGDAAHLGSPTAPRYHSFRHSFTDALRLAAVPGEINVALVGHTDPNVNDKVRREGQGDTLSPQARRSGCERGLCRTGPGAFDEPAGHTRHQGAHTPRRR